MNVIPEMKMTPRQTHTDKTHTNKKQTNKQPKIKKRRELQGIRVDPKQKQADIYILISNMG